MSFPVTTRGPQTAADWSAANPVLSQFEIGIEVDPATGAYTKAKIGNGVTPWNSLQYFDPTGNGMPGVKVYQALLTQSGTDAPVATVLENSLGGTVVWTYATEGLYTGTLAEAFLVTKTSQWYGILNAAGTFYPNRPYACGRGDNNTLTLQSFNTGAPQDGILQDSYVEILVYP